VSGLEHVVVVVAPLAGRARGVRALEDQLNHAAVPVLERQREAI
jgi:hypothetical protein